MDNATFPPRSEWFGCACSLHEAASNDNGTDGDILAICAYGAAYAALWEMMPLPWQGDIPPKGELLAEAEANLRLAALRLLADQKHAERAAR